MKHICAYCNRTIPENAARAWVMEKEGEGICVRPWIPAAQAIVFPQAWYKLCSFDCAEALLRAFILRTREGARKGQ